MEDTLLTPEQYRELNDWVNGKTIDVPDFLRTQSVGMLDKIAFSMNSIINTSIKRTIRLQEFIEKAEIELYSDQNILKYEPETLAIMYKEANKSLSDLTETIRKYVTNNKDLLAKSDSQSDKVRNILMSLPKEKLDMLVNFIEVNSLEE